MAVKLTDLTSGQLKTLADFDMLIRPVIVQVFKALRQARAASQQYNSTVVGVLSLLDGTEKLPGASGLAGATEFDQADWGYLVSYLDSLTGHFDTNLNSTAHQALYVKAAGSMNLAE